MYALTCHITIGNATFDFPTEVSMVESTIKLTDTCLLKFPKKILWNNSNIFFGSAALIKKRDVVEVKLGYDGILKTVFKGYVRAIHRKSPVEIECEDEMFRLKWPEVIVKQKRFDSVTLKDLLKYIIPSDSDIEFIAPDMNLGKFDISQDCQPVEVLENLTKKDGYGLQCYFQNIDNCPTLFVGLPQAHFMNYAKTHKFKFNYNIINDNLNYIDKDDLRIKLKCISIMPDNTKYEVEVGESDGELRTFNFYNIPKADLKKLAEDKLTTFKVEGYTGTITVFGEPVVTKGDIVQLYDDRYVDVVATYSVCEVKRTYGTGGYRQEITLDGRLGWN